MIFEVSEECRELGLRAGAIVFRDVRVSASGAGLRNRIAREAAEVRQKFASPADIRRCPEVAAFHDIHRRVGGNPRRLPPSVDRLLNFALKRGDLPAVNNLVDCYNLVSIRALLSLGAHDLDLIALPVALRILSGREPFTPLGSVEAQAVVPGEFGYVDAQNRLLCRLDVLQADFSKVAEQARNVLLIVEGTAAHAAEQFRSACAEVIELVRAECGGTYSYSKKEE